MELALDLARPALQNLVDALNLQIENQGVDPQRIPKGTAVMCLGVLFVRLGVSLLFNRPLIIIGNVLLVAGPVYIFDFEHTRNFLRRESNRMASCCFLGGIFLVLNRSLVIGMPLEIYGVFSLIKPHLPPHPIRYLIDVVTTSFGLKLEEHETTATSTYVGVSALLALIKLGLLPTKFGLACKILGLACVVPGFAYLLYKSDNPWQYKLTSSCVFAVGVISHLIGWFVVGVIVMGLAHIRLFSVSRRLIPYLREVLEPLIAYLRKVPGMLLNLIKSLLIFQQAPMAPMQEAEEPNREPLETAVFLLIQQYLPPYPFGYLNDAVTRSLGVQLEEHEKTVTSWFKWSSALLALGLGFTKIGLDLTTKLGLALGSLGLANITLTFACLLYKSDHPWQYKLAASCVFVVGVIPLHAGWFDVGAVVTALAYISLFSVFERLIPYLRNVPVLGFILFRPAFQQVISDNRRKKTRLQITDQGSDTSTATSEGPSGESELRHSGTER